MPALVDRHLGSFFIWDYYEWNCYEHMCKIFCLNTFLSFLAKISVLKWLSHIKSVYFKEPVTIFCNMSVLFGFLLATYESYSCFLLLLEIFSIDDPPDRWSNPKWPVLQTYTDKQEQVNSASCNNKFICGCRYKSW